MFRRKLRVSISCVACDATQLSAIMPLTLAELEGKSVKELRALARERRVDTSAAVERSDLVDSLMAGPREA